MRKTDLQPEALIADWEASLREAYALAGRLTRNDQEATALLIETLESAFDERPAAPPSRRELLSRVARQRPVRRTVASAA
jgi:hypothetical protein